MTPVSKGATLRSPLRVPAEERQRRFEQVYAECHGPIPGYVLRRTGNSDDAADIMAETFLTAWRRLDEVPPVSGFTALPGRQSAPGTCGQSRAARQTGHAGEARNATVSAIRTAR